MAIAAPTAPASLTSTALKATSFTLNWSVSTGGTGGIAGYDVYKNGTLIGSTTTVRTFAVVGLSPAMTCNMTVVARDGTSQVSTPSAPLAVTTPPDTTNPSKPANLAVVAITTTSCLFTWDPATDDVGVTGYNIYRNNILVGSAPAELSFTVLGLNPDTSNTLTVRAIDAAGNLSAASTGLSVHTLANPPSTPAGLAATALKDVSFTLTWTASTGGTGGIAGYDIYQNGALIGSTTSARSFAVSGLSPTTAYNMTVTARDTANRISSPSATLTVTTPADTTNPGKPTGLAASVITTTSCALAWNAATDDVGVTGYNIYRNNVLVGSSPRTNFNLTGLSPGSVNNLTIRAVDAAGNLSAASVAVAVQTLANPPSVPVGLVAANLRPSSFVLQWTASTGGTGGIAGYDVYLNGAVIGSPIARSLAITGLTPTTTYTFTVTSRDTAGRISAVSAPFAVTTPADTAKPTVPVGLSAAAVTSNAFAFTWTASTDNVGVIAYDVFRNNVLIGSTANSNFSVSGLLPSTTSSMRVKARDAAGNISGFSAILLVTTSAPPNIPPAVALTAPLDGSTVTLPSTLNLTALATDSDGTIAKVEFFDGTTKLGETSTPTVPNTFVFSITPTSTGSHSLTARATDNRNATTDSTSVVILINNLNFAPTVTLTTSLTGTGLTAPGFLTLSAEATDGDGTIAKVGFYESGNLLGEISTPSTSPSTFTFPVTLFSTGTYTITAVATDNSNAQSTSIPIVINVNSGAAALPFVSNFESAEGYGAGLLSGQLSWVASNGVRVVPSTASGSLQEVSIPAAQPAEIFSHDFSALGISPVFVDFRARPVAGTDPTTAVMFSTPAAQVALVGSGSPAQLWTFGGGVGWQSTGQSIATDANGRTNDWIRLTTREDYVTKKWDLYLNGQMISADLGFADVDAGSLSDFSVNGHGTEASAFDDFYAGAQNPLFADINHNGIDDAWETSHGLSLSTDNRQLTPAGNGVTVLQSYIQGTDPNDFYSGTAPMLAILDGDNQVAPPGQFNSFPFDVEVWNASGTAPMVNAPVTFTVQSGSGKLALTNTSNPALVTTLNTTTDANGTAQVYFQQPSTFDATSSISAAAGTAQVTFTTQSGAAPPQPLTVNLTAPLTGSVLDGAFGVVLVADAHSLSNSVAKVEFFVDDAKVGESTSTPFYFIWPHPPVGSHGLTAIVSDNQGASLTSAPVAITIRPTAPAIIFNDFEVTEGFSPGALNGQNGWTANETESALVTSETAQSGSQSVVILPPSVVDADVNFVATQLPPFTSDHNVRFIDFWTKLVAGDSPYRSSYIYLKYSPIIAFVRSGNVAELQALETGGEGASDIHWSSGLFVPVTDDGTTSEWHRITIRENVERRLMDVYLDGQPALTGMGFATSETSLSIFGHAQSPTRIDHFQLVTDNPLFADADSDGMDDGWEAAHGLNPSLDDRNSYLNGDHVLNIIKFFFNLDPNAISSTSDGLPDSWKIQFGFNPRRAIPATQDTDGDGVPDIFEYRAGTSPLVVDSNNDGIADGEEDPDGDGLTNAQEALLGTDPHDFYNGQTPLITPLADYSNAFGPNGMIAVRVTTQSGIPLGNAPIEFTTSDENLLTINPYGRGNATTLVTRADSQGVARVYVRPANQ